MQGYIHKSEVPKLCYLLDSDIENFLLKDKQYNFSIKRFDPKNEIIELSRKNYLEDNNFHIDYGNVYEGYIAKINPHEIYIYSNEFEGRVPIKDNIKHYKIGAKVKVLPNSKSRNEFSFLKTERV